MPVAKNDVGKGAVLLGCKVEIQHCPWDVCLFHQTPDVLVRNSIGCRYWTQNEVMQPYAKRR
eukprot:scaffold650369_cov50-Prasinocladus_malaysianus.AAC.1